MVVHYIGFELYKFQGKIEVLQNYVLILFCFMSGIWQTEDLKFNEMILVFLPHFLITQTRIPNPKCTAFLSAFVRLALHER